MWAPIGRVYRFIFHRKPRDPSPSSTEGKFVPKLDGFCMNCGFRPDPELPGICFCNDGSALARARVHVRADTGRNDD
jgi:diadenosine tetraphosphatase ApaH/serine/threonine PP2A family protein phosphatase